VPTLIAMCGLPFAGKSVLAGALSRELRREIGAILASGESLIYDDLLLGREDRRKLAAVAEARWAELVLVYLDTPLSVIDKRRAANSRTRTRISIPEAKMRLDITLLEPPEDAERAIYVSPDYVLPEVLARISARLTGS